VQREGEKKSCDFQCGVDSTMPDDFSKSLDLNSADFTPIGWAYLDGSGATCHACKRILQTELSHHWEGKRAKYKAACMADLQLLNSHRDRRRAYVARKSRGKAWISGRKAAGVRKTKLKSTTKDDIKLIKPKDQF
jgi:hypothetical protein